jgi:hypothetical protein
VNYESYIERIIRPVLGGLQLREIQDRVEVLDELYAQLRRCRRLCGGRRGLVDHRPVGQGRRRPDGEPDHQYDERCVPHRCKAASASAIHQIHAILHRAFAIAVKWRWMDRNPADQATQRVASKAFRPHLNVRPAAAVIAGTGPLPWLARRREDDKSHHRTLTVA